MVAVTAFPSVLILTKTVTYICYLFIADFLYSITLILRQTASAYSGIYVQLPINLSPNNKELTISYTKAPNTVVFSNFPCMPRKVLTSAFLKFFTVSSALPQHFSYSSCMAYQNKLCNIINGVHVGFITGTVPKRSTNGSRGQLEIWGCFLNITMNARSTE